MDQIKPAKQSDKYSWIWLCANCSAEYAADVEAMECCGEPIPNTEPDTQDIQIGGDHYRTKAVQPWDAMEDKLMDNVNHPNHYQGKIECIDAIEVAVGGLRGIEAVFVANILKYVWRYRKKNGIEDLRKASWYLERLIKEVENNDKTRRHIGQ